MYVYCLYVSEYPAWAFERVISGAKPVVVASGGRVVSRNHTQRLRGIQIGDRLERVERLCPEAIIRVQDVQVEQACWEELLGEVNAETPFIDDAGPPCVFFSDVAPERVRLLAQRMKVQIGAAWHPSAARLAAIRSAPGHVLRLEQNRWISFLNRFEVGRLAELAFSVDMLEQLALFGYRTLGGVYRLSERQINAQFGEDGRYLYDMLHPDKARSLPLYVPPRAVECWLPFEDDVGGEPGMLYPALLDLVMRATEQLGGYRCQRIRVGLQLPGARLPEWSGRVLSAPRGVSGTLYRLAVPLLDGMLRYGMEVAELGVRLDSLRTPSVEQMGLFDERPVVLKAVRNVHRRYPGSIRRAVVRPDALFEEDELTLESIRT